MFDMERTVYNCIKILFRLLGLIPQKWQRISADFLGRIVFLADRRHRRIVIDSLTHAFGRQKNRFEIRILAKRVFINLVQIIFEIGWSLSLDEKQLRKYFTIDGRSNIKNAYEKDRGVLVLTAHFGNFELLAVIGAMIKYPLSPVVRPLSFKPLDRFFVELRTRFGAKIIPKQRSFREILRSLERKELVVLLMDQNVDWYEGVFVDFMGRRACTNSGLALLALKTQAPVVPVFLIREKTGFRAEFGPEIPLIKTGDKRKDVELNTLQYNRIIEDVIRRYSEQWFWVHQRWKTKPYHPWPKVADK
ncbi:MAG: lysophospholipid acyltransferase family protein [Deltaproteobacteria bacterium]|nr:lysophospholipid acyltransferase family protein [Deltaproteobacteria bacterium]MBW2237650.1 lysophospholipid acyltransferase family protein [Deltaproteobacteria bacterium]